MPLTVLAISARDLPSRSFAPYSSVEPSARPHSARLRPRLPFVLDARSVADATKRAPNACSTSPGTDTWRSSFGHESASPAGDNSINRSADAWAASRPGTIRLGIVISPGCAESELDHIAARVVMRTDDGGGVAGASTFSRTTEAGSVLRGHLSSSHGILSIALLSF